jgi:hypothetical protein
MGELPIGWNTNGSGAVSKLQGLDGKLGAAVSKQRLPD